MSNPGRLPRTTLWQISKCGVALLLVGFILSRTNWKAMTTVWGQISLPWLLLSTVAYGATVLIQASRSWILLDRGVPLGELLEAQVIKTVVSNTLADGAAMVSYLALLRQRHHISIVMGAFSVLGARLADVMVFGLVLVVSATYQWQQLIVLHGVIALLGAGVLLLWVLLIITLLFRRQVVAGVCLLTHFSRLERFSFVRRTKAPLTTLIDADSWHMRWQAANILSYTTLLQGLYIAFTYCNMRLFHIHIGLLPLVFIVACSQVLSLIPIQVFGGLGVYDVTLMYLYGIFGFGHAVIVPVLIGLRVIFYAYNPLLLVYLPWHRRPRRTADVLGAGPGMPHESI